MPKTSNKITFVHKDKKKNPNRWLFAHSKSKINILLCTK